MNVRIAIVEDEQQCSDLLKGYIEKYALGCEDVFDVAVFSDGDAILDNYKPVYDIIFLDIKMKILDGMTTAENIRKVDKDVIIVFTTNMAQYAISGYKVGALDFLLKPIPYFAFSEQLRVSLERLKNNRSQYILLQTDGGVAKIDTALIIYVESFKHKMLVKTKDKTYTITTTMQELEKKLNKNFFRCHKGYLVNLAFVNSIEGNKLYTSGGHELLISRGRRRELLEALTAYVGLL